MKFNMVNLGYRSTPDYPYDYRIEIFDYSPTEWSDIHSWIYESRMPHTLAGRGDVIYLRKNDATLFALRWL